MRYCGSEYTCFFFINFVDNVGGFLVKGLVMYPSTHFPSFSLHSLYPVRLSYWYLVPTLSSLDTDVCSCYGSSLIYFSYWCFLCCGYIYNQAVLGGVLPREICTYTGGYVCTGEYGYIWYNRGIIYLGLILYPYFSHKNISPPTDYYSAFICQVVRITPGLLTHLSLTTNSPSIYGRESYLTTNWCGSCLTLFFTCNGFISNGFNVWVCRPPPP